VWIAQTLLAVVLSLLAWRITLRAAFIYRKESAAKQEATGKPASQPAAAAAGLGRQLRRTWSGKLRPARKQRASSDDRESEKQGEQTAVVTLKGGGGGSSCCVPKVAAAVEPPEPLSQAGIDQQQQLNGQAGAAASNRKGAAFATAASSASTAVQPPPPAAADDWTADRATDSFSELASGPFFWEPSVLPTLEAQLAIIGSGDWSEDDWSHRPAASPTRPPPPSEAESRLAYAPPHERSGEAEEEAPELGGGLVDGVPIASPRSGGGKLPSPEVAGTRVADELSHVLASEAVQLPPWHIAGLLVMCGVLLLTSLFSKREACGSWRFWVIQVAAVPVLLALFAVARWDVLRKARVKKAAQIDWTGEMRWSRRNTLLYPAICIGAGLVAGVFGLGGGIVFTPLMLELGTHPQVTAATTQTMLLFTTGASTVVFAQMGDVPWHFAAVLMALAFVWWVEALRGLGGGGGCRLAVSRSLSDPASQPASQPALSHWYQLPPPWLPPHPHPPHAAPSSASWRSTASCATWAEAASSSSSSRASSAAAARSLTLSRSARSWRLRTTREP